MLPQQRRQLLQLFLGCFLVFVAQIRAPLVLLHDLREYDPETVMTMPVSTITDATPPYPALVTVVAMHFHIPLNARDCNALKADVALAHRIGVNARPPTFISAWLWSGATALDKSGFKITNPPLIWSGNVTVPATLMAEMNVSKGVSHTVLATHRLDFPHFSRALVGGRDYWLGLSIGVARARDIASETFNELRWLVAANTLIPVSRWNATLPYKVIDRNGNNLALRHAEFKNWTTASVAEPFIMTPLHSVSVTNHLAALLTAQCLGPGNISDPMVIKAGIPPPLYDPALVPTPTPTPVPSPPPTGKVSIPPMPATPVVDAGSVPVITSNEPAAAAAIPTLSPVTGVSPSPVGVVVSPIQAPSVIIVTSTTTATVTTPAVKTPGVSGPMPVTAASTTGGASPPSLVVVVPVETLSSSSPPPLNTITPNDKLNANDGSIWISRNWQIILAVVGGVLLLLCLAGSLWLGLVYYTKQMRKKRHDANYEQLHFNQKQDLLLNQRKGDDAGTLPLESYDDDDDDSRNSSLSSSAAVEMDEHQQSNGTNEDDNNNTSSGGEDEEPNVLMDDDAPEEVNVPIIPAPVYYKDEPRMQEVKLPRVKQQQQQQQHQQPKPVEKNKGKGKINSVSSGKTAAIVPRKK